MMLSRRTIMAGLLTAALGTATTTSAATAATTAPTTPQESVYFGVGCFWHIQHEFIEGERTLLGRTDQELSAATGYAGGKAAGSEGRVCYHNMRSIADYGKLGHGEVVGMDLPTDKIVEFAALYFSLFNPKTGDRVDPGDKGGEYRSLIGLPGGTQHPVYPMLQATAAKAGFKLEAGKGNDPDTLHQKLVYVYDTAAFPFYQAEVYHQYHDDFQSPAYGKAYNSLADLAFDDGRLKMTGCPDRV